MPPNGSIFVFDMPPFGILISGVIIMYFKRLTDLREDNDKTQKEIAELLCCRREVYRRYEKGTREIPISYAIILAKYYNVSLDYLFELTDERESS